MVRAEAKPWGGGAPVALTCWWLPLQDAHFLAGPFGALIGMAASGLCGLNSKTMNPNNVAGASPRAPGVPGRGSQSVGANRAPHRASQRFPGFDELCT